MELTDQQKHLKRLKEQQDEVITRHTKASAEVNECRDMIMKLQGAIDYLEQIGVTIQETEDDSDKDNPLATEGDIDGPIEPVVGPVFTPNPD
jgi:hypothetical protein